LLQADFQVSPCPVRVGHVEMACFRKSTVTYPQELCQKIEVLKNLNYQKLIVTIWVKGVARKIQFCHKIRLVTYKIVILSSSFIVSKNYSFFCFPEDRGQGPVASP
jgi:hypothetical protein